MILTRMVKDLVAGDRVMVGSAIAQVKRVILNSPHFPEIQIQWEGTIAHTARTEYMPTEKVFLAGDRL